MAFRNERRQVTVEKRTVFIGTINEAAQIVADFTTAGVVPFEKKYGCTFEEAKALMFAAGAFICSYQRRFVSAKTLTDLGIDLTPELPAEPTWVSQDGQCRYVRNLATSHLVNIVRKFAGHQAGIFKAIRSELNRRPDRD